jgi:hypothetical protein
MAKKSARNFFLVSVLLETSARVRESDFDVQSDDVIDGFTISRNDRLGDITENFYLSDFSNVDVRKIVDLKGSDDLLRGIAIVQHNHRGNSQEPCICRSVAEVRLALGSLIKEAHGKNFRAIRKDEDINAYYEEYQGWLAESSEYDEVNYWFFEN